MKKVSFLLFCLIFFICATQAHAIQTNGNGKTQAFESSGEVKNVESNNGKAIAAVSGAAIAGPSAQPIVEKQEKKAVFQIFFDNLQSFFKNLFRFL